MTIFNKELINELNSKDIFEIWKIIRQKYHDEIIVKQRVSAIVPNDTFIELYSFMLEALKANNFDYEFMKKSYSAKEISDNLFKFIATVEKDLENETTAMKISSHSEIFRNAFGKGFIYVFSDGDLDRVQLLINEMREIIKKVDNIDEEYRARLLKKLEKLQQELHKKVSTLDNIWGFIGEAGVALGKFGKDSEPFLDKVNETLRIVWSTQARAEELPSDSPMALLKEENKSNKEI